MRDSTCELRLEISRTSDKSDVLRPFPAEARFARQGVRDIETAGLRTACRWQPHRRQAAGRRRKRPFQYELPPLFASELQCVEAIRKTDCSGLCALLGVRLNLLRDNAQIV